MTDNKITSLGNDNAWFLPPHEEDRQAVAALRGYAYQLHQTAAAWIGLGENEQLYLEVAEDFARVATAPKEMLEAVQTKDTRKSGSVTLNSPDILKAIRSLFELQAANPGREVCLTFLTTSPAGKEAKDPLTSGESGIAAWERAAKGGEVDTIRAALKKRLNEPAIVSLLSRSSDSDLRKFLLKRLTFVCGTASWDQVEARNRRALVAMRDDVDATEDEAHRAYDAILGKVLRTILDSDKRMLDRQLFLTCFREATSIEVRIPSNLVQEILGAKLRRTRPVALNVAEARLADLCLSVSGKSVINDIRSRSLWRQPLEFVYCENIRRSVEKLQKREERPERFFEESPRLRRLQDHKERQERAAWLHEYNTELMRKVRKAVDHNANGLSELIRHLERLSASDDEAKASLTAFASLAALIMIRNLKRGFDWSEEGAPQPWFEAYKFNSDPSYCLLDWVPRQSPTGRAVFNFRYWVGARVGHEKHYEYVMFPLKSVLPLFRDGVEGNTEAFYRWVLPQLVLLGAYKPIEEFPVADWEPFLLQGANATEWWSRYSPCPWPEVVGPIDMVEL